MMIKPKAEMAFGIPVWDIYACTQCGSLLLPSTEALHKKFHENYQVVDDKPKTKSLDCKVCGETLVLPLDSDGAMILDDYDDHMDSHAT